MGYAFTEEQEIIQQTAREFTQGCIEPAASEIDRTALHPQELVQSLAEQGFMGMFLPGEFDGAEAGFLCYALIVEEISKSSGAMASILNHHAAMAAYSINAWGSKEQKEQYLPAMCSGEILGAFAFAEPDAAPGVGEHKVTARKDGNSYILNGRKCYVANGGEAGVYVVIALTDPGAGLKGMSAFLVDGDASGLSVVRTIKKMGLRGCQSAEILFDNVEIPANNLLGAEGDGLAIVAKAQAVAGVAEGAMVVGIAQAAMDDAVKYGMQRIQFKQPIARFPAIQTMLAEMATNIHMLRLAVYHAAGLIENDEPFAAEAAMIKLAAARIGQNALIDVVQIEGGYGYSEDMAVSRFFRDIKGVITKNSSVDFPETVIAKSLLD